VVGFDGVHDGLFAAGAAQEAALDAVPTGDGGEQCERRRAGEEEQRSDGVAESLHQELLDGKGVEVSAVGEVAEAASAAERKPRRKGDVEDEIGSGQGKDGGPSGAEERCGDERRERDERTGDVEADAVAEEIEDNSREIVRKQPSPELRRAEEDSEKLAAENPALHAEGDADDDAGEEERENEVAFAQQAGEEEQSDADVAPELILNGPGGAVDGIGIGVLREGVEIVELAQAESLEQDVAYACWNGAGERRVGERDEDEQRQQRADNERGVDALGALLEEAEDAARAFGAGGDEEAAHDEEEVDGNGAEGHLAVGPEAEGLAEFAAGAEWKAVGEDNQDGECEAKEVEVVALERGIVRLVPGYLAHGESRRAGRSFERRGHGLAQGKIRATIEATRIGG
jgi:hypothetical protein